VIKLTQAYPQSRVELWCMDEHRVGLKPVIRRVWARKGQRPLIRVQQRYEWLYVYGFVHPESGDTHWLLRAKLKRESTYSQSKLPLLKCQSYASFSRKLIL
jgi:hypothetical protein